MDKKNWVFIDSLPYEHMYYFSFPFINIAEGVLIAHGGNMVAYFMGASQTSVDTFILFNDTIFNDANGYLIVHDTTAHNYYFKKLTKGGGGVGLSSTYRNNIIFAAGHDDYVIADTITFIAPPLANFYGDQQAVLLYLDWDEYYVGLEPIPHVQEPQVFPNPVEETVHIFLEGDYTFIIRDVLGRVVESGMGMGMTSVSTVKLSAGCYFLELNTGTQTFIIKLIKP